MTAERTVMLVKKVTCIYFREFGYLNSSCIRKSIALMFLSSLSENSHFCTCSKTQWQMFLLVSCGIHPSGHQHCVSIQISINLGTKFVCISCIRKIAVTWILVRVFSYLSFFLFSDCGLNLLNSFGCYFDLFWMVWHWKPAIIKTKYVIT